MDTTSPRALPVKEQIAEITIEMSFWQSLPHALCLVLLHDSDNVATPKM